MHSSIHTPNNDLRAYQEWDDRQETYLANRERDNHGLFYEPTPEAELHDDAETAIGEGGL